MTSDPAIAEMPDPPAYPDGAWVVVFEPLPGDVPVAVRMRHLLKRALRQWGLRCIHVGTREPMPLIVPQRKRKTKAKPVTTDCHSHSQQCDS